MRRILVRCIAILVVAAAAISVQAQDSTSPEEQDAASPPAAKRAKPPTQTLQPPDMVCFGAGTKRSIQFVSWGARLLGVNQPDQDFLGGFFWEPDRKVWVWQMSSGYTLSATVQKATCTDPERKGTFPYAAQVNLPEGDILSGCCRKLKPEEAPVAPPAPPSNKPAPH